MFILTYAEENALILPGRVPGYCRSDIQLYLQIFLNEISGKFIQLLLHLQLVILHFEIMERISSFSNIMKPMTDLCWQCQQNSTAVIRCTNCNEADKSVVIRNAVEHLRNVHFERSYYNAIASQIMYNFNKIPFQDQLLIYFTHFTL